MLFPATAVLVHLVFCLLQNKRLYRILFLSVFTHTMDTWITNDKQNPRVKHEENAVQAQSTQGTIDMFAEDAPIGKMMCMCNPNCILNIEQKLKKAFPELSIAKSSTYLLEIMPSGVTKSTAVKTLCKLWNIPLEDTIAFGDNYNDLEMLETVAQPFLMENAPGQSEKKISSDRQQ